MKARKKFFTMFLSMLLVFTMMPLSAIPVTAASSTDPPPAALDQTKLVDETLTETDIQTETESTTTPEPPPASETPDGSQNLPDAETSVGPKTPPIAKALAGEGGTATPDPRYSHIQLKFSESSSDRILLRDCEYITVGGPHASPKLLPAGELEQVEFVQNGDYVALYYNGSLHLKGDLRGACIDMQAPRYSDAHVKIMMIQVRDDVTLDGMSCLLYGSEQNLWLRIAPGKTLTINADRSQLYKYHAAIYSNGGDVTVSGGGTLNINYQGKTNPGASEDKIVKGIYGRGVSFEYDDNSLYLGSPTVNINMNNGGSGPEGDAVTGISTGKLTVKDKAKLNIEVTGRALDPKTESYQSDISGRVNKAIGADSMKLLDDASVDIISHKNVISDIYLTGSGEVLTVNTTGHLNIKNEGNIERYPKPTDGVDTRDLPSANIKAPTGASVKFEKAQEGVFIDSYAKTINQWYDTDIAGTGDSAHHWAIEGTLVLGTGMYRGDHRVGETVKDSGSSRYDIIYGTARFIYSGLGVHTVKVSRGIGMAKNGDSGYPVGRVKEPEFNDIYIVKQGDWLELTAPEGKGKFLYWYDATSDDNTEGGTTWTNQTQRFDYFEKDMVLVPVYDVMTKEPTLSPLRYVEGGTIFSNYSCHDLDFAYDGTGIDDNHGFRVYLVPARLPKYGEVMQHVTMLDERYCVSFKPGKLFADKNHPSSGAAYNDMSIAPGKYRIAVGDWGGGRGYWYFSEPFEFNPPVAPPYIAPKSTFFQGAGSQQVTITAEREAAIQYRLWNYNTNTWGSYQNYTDPFTVSYTADQDARIEARATGSAEDVTTKVEYAVQPTAIPTVKYGDRVLADAGSAYPGERYYYGSMELQVEPLEGYDIYYRVGYEPHGRNGSETCGTKLGEDGKVTISGTGTEQEQVYFRARKSLPGREGEWSRTSARLTLKEVTALPVPNVTFYDGDTKVTPDSTNTVFFHEKLTAVLSETTYWPINVEMRYTKSTSTVGGKSEAYTVPVEYTSEGYLWVSARATLADGSSASDSSNSVRYTIQQDASHVKKTMTVASPIAGVQNINGTPIDPDYTDSTTRKYQINVGKEIKVTGYAEMSGGKVFYRWKADPDVVVFSDPHSPTTTFTMPDKDFTLTAEYKAPEVITRDTNIILDAGKPAGKSLSLSQMANGVFSEWRHLTYQWYEGDSAAGTPLNNFDSFETGKAYTARVTITVTEGCTFANTAAVQTKTSPSSGYIGVADGKLTRATDNKSIAFDLHLLTKPELTMELAPGDTLPTAEALTDQLPEGYTVKTLTWEDNATMAPSSAGEIAITKLEIVPADGSYQLANSSVWINGTERTGTYNSYTLTLTNITVPVQPKGVEVSGTAKSYNPGNATTIQLKQNGEEKYKTTIDADSGSGQKEQSFSFPAVAPGTYDLVVTKPGHLTYTVKGVVVGDGPLDLTQHTNAAISTMTLLCGDIDGNEKVNAADLNIVWNAANFNKAVVDANNQLTDVNGDGKVNAADLNIVWNAANFNKGTGDCTFEF